MTEKHDLIKNTRVWYQEGWDDCTKNIIKIIDGWNSKLKRDEVGEKLIGINELENLRELIENQKIIKDVVPMNNNLNKQEDNKKC